MIGEMGSSVSPKLSLDLSPPPWVHPSPPCSSWERADESSEYIAALEDELRKIEAFKRVLPLSHLILNDAIAKLKEDGRRSGKGAGTTASARSSRYQKSSGINLEKSDDQVDKRSWMSSVQLWSPGSDQSSPLPRSKSSLKDIQEDKAAAADDQVIIGQVGSVVEVSSLRNGTLIHSGRGEEASASATTNTNSRTPLKSEGVWQIFRGGEGYAHELRKSPPPRHQHALLSGGKQRRCWSPDLHRRFVDALDKLGGSQVATPKQIRELMQVDGLTNDEVKSHLQKYRLHIRKLPGTCSMSLSAREHDSEVKGTRNESASPEPPFHIRSSSAAKSNSGANNRCHDNSLEEEMLGGGGGYEDEDEEEEKSDVSHSLGWKE